MNLKKLFGLNEYSTWSGAASLGSVGTMFMSEDPLMGKLCAIVIVCVNAIDIFRKEKKNG